MAGKQANHGKQVTARAWANIALCKYWGKLGPDNAPATPSLSLALDGLATTTSVTAINRQQDVVLLDGQPAAGAARRRVLEFVDRWRTYTLVSGHFRIESHNDFPTAAGLASSASAYAALTVALAGHAVAELPTGALSRLARMGSGSAARSITGGLSALGAGRDPAAQLLAPAGEVPWGMVVAVVEAPAKEISSREGMELSRRTSPFYRAWVLTDRYHYRELAGALKSWDLAKTGELMEENMLAMHACMLTTQPALIYWSPATLAVLHALREWRRKGLNAWATIDAGAHVALLCDQRDLNKVAGKLKALAEAGAGIRQVIPCRPAGGAMVIS
ncbi:diphosphomevalonate decarboxylase [bacterium]|nr:diphosphomevalonate decarboxylase [bacterium]